MTQYTMYVCETCGFESKDFNEMEAHEASHLGLTYDELLQYRKLQEAASQAGIATYYKNNATTQKQFDEAIEALVLFEKEHGITGRCA